MWSIIYCDEWDHDLGEPAWGGRNLGEAPTRRRALEMARFWALAISRGMLPDIPPGEGDVIVTNPEHQYYRAIGTGARRQAA